MPKVFVSCPTCVTKLELAEEHLGEMVQCGSCHQEFEAKRDRPAKRDRDDEEEDRPRRRRKRRRRDDDYYDDNSVGSDAGLGIAALVLGILSVPGLCCWPVGVLLAIGAVTCGSLGQKSEGGRGMAIAGLVLGSLTLILVVGLLILGLGLNAWNVGGGGGGGRGFR